MMSNTFTLVPVLVCASMMFVMFGGAVVLLLATRTPLGRLPWFERRARRAHEKAAGVGRPFGQ